MRKTPNTNYLFILLSFVISILLTVVPLSGIAAWARPQFVFATLLFWMITSPTQCGILLAWCAGIMMDCLTGTPIGQQALIFVLLAYVLLKLHPIVAYATILQQAFFVAIFAALNELCQGMILGWTGHSTHVVLHGLSAITTAVMWPWWFEMLDRFRPSEMIR